MPKTIPKEDIKVKLVLLPGPISPTQKQAWRVWWARSIASVHEELDNDEKSKNA